MCKKGFVLEDEVDRNRLYLYFSYDFCRNADKRQGQSCEKVLGEEFFFGLPFGKEIS